MARDDSIREIIMVFLEKEIAKYLTRHGKKIEDLDEKCIQRHIKLLNGEFQFAFDSISIDDNLVTQIKERLLENWMELG
jgi:hypothetical protein